MSHNLHALSLILRAAVLVLDAELVEDAPVQSDGDAPESGPSNSSGPANDQDASEPQSKRRKGVRPAYRPQGPVDEVNARRADEALKRAGLLPVPPRRK
jgi:hypothetical protein